jgi:Lrp/AsnC family transcriptional regulator for asnA, asnC and gidA
MKNSFQIDNLDRKILDLITLDARIPFLEVARKCNISGAAVHQRINKLIEAGIISGSRFNLSPKALGYHTCAFIGLQVSLVSTSTHEEVFNRIYEIPEIVECHNITGKYSLLLKIFTKSNEHLKNVIVEKIQSIPEIISTETFISLEEGFTRTLPVK